MNKQLLSKQLLDVPIFCDKNLNIFDHNDTAVVIDYWGNIIQNANKIKVQLKNNHIKFISKYGEEELSDTSTMISVQNNIVYHICLGYLKC